MRHDFPWATSSRDLILSTNLRALDSRCVKLFAASPTWVSAVLQSQSRNVMMYLARAAWAREQARLATLKSERTFHERMEQRWLDLAASTAFVERVDLFLHTLDTTTPPHGTCPHCDGLMSVELLEITRYREMYTLRCGRCGGVERRMVVPAAPAASGTHASSVASAAPEVVGE